LEKKSGAGAAKKLAGSPALIETLCKINIKAAIDSLGTILR